MNNYGSIYLIINQINGLFYIGKTKRSLQERIHDYKSLNCKSQKKLYEAIKLFGWENFTIHIIDIAFNKEDLKQLEIYYIDYFKSFYFGYNGNKGGGGVNMHTSHTIEKMKNAQTGQNHHRWGKKDSEETKIKKSMAQKGKIFTKEHKINISKNHHDISGNKNPNYNKNISILCNENQIVYRSFSEAAKFLNLNRGNISNFFKSKQKYVSDKNGKRFTFILIKAIS